MSTLREHLDAIINPGLNRCCEKLGYPRGVGSPKNDDAIRKLRGWGSGE